VAIAQDRAAEKAHFVRCGVPVAPHAVIETAAQLAAVGDDLLPGILKTARMGYDGKGQVRVNDAAALRNYYESVKDVVATTPSTVVITMTQPYFLAEYFLGSLWIMPKHVLDPKGLTDKYTFAETKSIDAAQANPEMKEFAEWYGSEEVRRDPKLNIGTGPYAYEEWKTGESVTLRRNDAFWAKGKDAWNPAYADKLVYKVINDRNSAVVALKNAEIDFMEYVPPTKYTEEIDTVATPHLIDVGCREQRDFLVAALVDDLAQLNLDDQGDCSQCCCRGWSRKAAGRSGQTGNRRWQEIDRHHVEP
jgi:ABC-type transport system substrate-binding protein